MYETFVIVVAKDEQDYEYWIEHNPDGRCYRVLRDEYTYVGDEGKIGISGLHGYIYTVLVGKWYKRKDLQHIAEVIRAIDTIPHKK